MSYETRSLDSLGRAREFTLTFTEKTRAGGRPRLVWADQSGARREAIAVGDNTLDSLRVVTGPSLGSLFIVQQLFEEYAANDPQHAYPVAVRNAANFPGGSAPPPGIFAAPVSGTYHRDVTGVLHACGGYRSANDQDPPPLQEEIATARDDVARYLENRMRDSLGTERWKRARDSLTRASSQTR